MSIVRVFPSVIRLLIPALAGALIAASARAAPDGSMEKSVVKITTYIHLPDFDSPWKKDKVQTRHHLGTVVDGGRILVSAGAVGYATLLEMTRFGRSEKVPLRISFVDYAVNLAVLVPENPGVLKGMQPLRPGNDLRIGDQAVLLMGHRARRTVQMPVRLREVGIRQTSTSYYSYTHYFFESRQKSGLGWSEPVIKNGRLVAMVSGLGGDLVFAIPARVIRHFLEDLGQPPYRGFARLGLGFRRLASPWVRRWLKAEDATDGIMVTRVGESSPFLGKVQKNDILLSVDGKTISDSGSYRHPVWGDISFVDLISAYHGGDTVKIAVLRQGQKLTLESTLRRYHPGDDLVPAMRFSPEPHLIFGGLVLQELNMGYLASWGKNWKYNAPDEMLYLWRFQKFPDKKPGDRVMILSRVLADAHNKGYEGNGNLIVEKVNNHPVHSIQDLRAALAAGVPDRPGLARFTFAYGGGDIILAYKGMADAHQRISRNYDIPLSGSFYSPDSGAAGH